MKYIPVHELYSNNCHGCAALDRCYKYKRACVNNVTKANCCVEVHGQRGSPPSVSCEKTIWILNTDEAKAAYVAARMGATA